MSAVQVVEPAKGTVYVYEPALGTAQWRYIARNNAAFAEFTVSSVELLGTKKLDLHFEHTFFCPAKTDAENAKTVGELAAILKSIGAVNIKATVIKITIAAQNIVASYDVLQVPAKDVDKLTTTIAAVCKDLIEMLSK